MAKDPMNTGKNPDSKLLKGTNAGTPFAAGKKPELPKRTYGDKVSTGTGIGANRGN